MAVIVPFESRSVPSIDRLVELVADDMQRVNTTILSRTGSQVALIPEVANHLISSGGKRLRPILDIGHGEARWLRRGRAREARSRRRIHAYRHSAAR